MPEVVQWESLDGLPQESPRISPGAVINRNPKGRNGITTFGAKMVRSACYSLQKQFRRRRLGFLTLTLPSNPEYLPLWVLRWPELVRKFTQEFKREMERVGGVPELVGVTEIQTERTEKTRFCIPHFHAVYVSWDGKSKSENPFKGDRKLYPCFYVSHHRMQEIWQRILFNEVDGILPGIPKLDEIKPRVDVQGVKKSAEGYLGKYMSKGAEDVKKYLDEYPDRTDIPSHWWHCTQGLRNVVKGLIKEIPPAMVELIINDSQALVEAGVLRFIRKITKVINGVERILGFAFRFAPGFNPTKPKDIKRAFSTA